MFGGGKGPMGGGGMLRAASRAVARTASVGNGGLQDPLSSSASRGSNAATSRKTRKLNASSGSTSVAISSAGSASNLPIPANSGLPGLGFSPTSSVVACDDFDWVSVEGSDDDDFGLGSVPSVDEVQDAVSALQQVFDGSSYCSESVRDQLDYCYNKDDRRISSSSGLMRAHSIGSELDWIEPSMQSCSSSISRPQAYDKVYDAFHLLRTEPSVQRMVISLSSDKAMWDAVMNNEVVREISDSYHAGISEAKEHPEATNKDISGSNPALDFVRWVFNNTKMKAMEVFGNLTKLLTELFKPHGAEKSKVESADPFQERLRTSVMLSVLVLLVVVVARAARI